MLSPGNSALKISTKKRKTNETYNRIHKTTQINRGYHGAAAHR